MEPQVSTTISLTSSSSLENVGKDVRFPVAPATGFCEKDQVYFCDWKLKGDGSAIEEHLEIACSIFWDENKTALNDTIYPQLEMRIFISVSFLESVPGITLHKQLLQRLGQLAMFVDIDIRPY